LARVVVVVESHAAGGSMLTVGAAADRGIDVMAVPGPVTSPASTGTNQLLHEGLAPARHAGDVLAALGDFRPWPAQPATVSRRGAGRGQPGQVSMWDSADGRTAPGRTAPGSTAPGSTPPGRAAPTPPLDSASRRVLDAIGLTPTATSVIADRTGLPVGVLSSVLLHLEGLDLIRGHGAWWERK
jgi:DNA processing protein